MTNNWKYPLLLLIALSLFYPCRSYSQGPQPSYFYNEDTELAWADCYFYHNGGSQQKLPFLPVVVTGDKRYPLGTNNFSKDVTVEAPLVFIGNGVVKEGVWNCYSGRRLDYTSGDIDVAGKVVMFCYDFPDDMNGCAAEEYQLENRISTAASRGAAGVILFSWEKEYPFPVATFDEDGIPEIPAIIVSRKSAARILESSGESAEQLFSDWEKAGKTETLELIANIAIRIEGAFKSLESENFLLKFREGELSADVMEDILRLNEKSIVLLLDFFKDAGNVRWKKMTTVYFHGFDSKVFYTHHWGFGLATASNVFNVHQGGAPSFGLIVHENTHLLTDLNWKQSSSFMSEGIAKCTEAMATDPEANHNLVRKFIREKTMLPLSVLVNHNIGQAGRKTIVGYPASGSFVAYLIGQYGLPKLKTAYELEGRSQEEKEKESTWIKVYGMPLSDLESAWLKWLSQ